jgi:hypothetical protein
MKHMATVQQESQCYHNEMVEFIALVAAAKTAQYLQSIHV